MTTYTAAIATVADVVTGDFCDVCVIVNEDGPQGPELTDKLALYGVELPERVGDPDRYVTVEQSAVDALAGKGWKVIGEWQSADNAIYGEAMPDYDNPLYDSWTGPAEPAIGDEGDNF